MCGIVGYVGERKAAQILVEGLKRLEYRGYDSAGIATISREGILIKKDIGRIEDINSSVKFFEMEGTSGISHCRWATHGKVTKENAHPHCNFEKTISLVHNGIIENYSELKKKLIKKGYRFSSDTDTEVIVHLIDSLYKGDLKEAVAKALEKVEGSYALGVISSEEPGRIIASRKESPLVIGLGSNENYIASDVPAILKNTNKIIYLENEEVADITKDKVEVFDLSGKRKLKKIETIEWDAEMAEKTGYKHFMLKEIHEQPRAIEETVKGRILNGDLNLGEELGLSAKEIKDIKRIIIVACGTSWHAGIVGEFMIEELTKIPVEVEYASEFRYRDPIIDKGTIVIAISQSGETADTLAALREAKKKGAQIIAICNVKGSSIARESDSVLYTHAGPEVGVASTKAFTCQLIVLYLLTVYFGKTREIIPKDYVRDRIRNLRMLPLQMQAVLEDRDYIKLHAEKFYKGKNALYLGRGINYPIALEGALKLKEISYIHAEGYPAAEMKHGPIALIDKDMPTVVIAMRDNRTYKKVLSNIEEIKSRGGIVIAVASKGDNEIPKKVDHTLYVPYNSYILNPILAVIPLQLLAYYIAVKRGCNVDKPRNLAKSVTVE